MGYRAPVGDMRFALEACKPTSGRSSRASAISTPILLEAILDGAGSLAAETLAPINRSGDRGGVTLQ